MHGENILLFIVIMTVITATSVVLLSWMRGRQRIAEIRAGAGSGQGEVRSLAQENAGLRAELGSIKDRLATVERIVTDGSRRLTDEIEALRLTSN
jgi:hypothetical protein